MGRAGLPAAIGKPAFGAPKLTCGWLDESRSRALAWDLLSASQRHESLGVATAGLPSCRQTGTTRRELGHTQPRRVHTRVTEYSLSSFNLLRNSHKVPVFWSRWRSVIKRDTNLAYRTVVLQASCACGEHYLPEVSFAAYYCFTRCKFVLYLCFVAIFCTFYGHFISAHVV